MGRVLLATGHLATSDPSPSQLFSSAQKSKMYLSGGYRPEKVSNVAGQRVELSKSPSTWICLRILGNPHSIHWSIMIFHVLDGPRFQRSWHSDDPPCLKDLFQDVSTIQQELPSRFPPVFIICRWFPDFDMRTAHCHVWILGRQTIRNHPHQNLIAIFHPCPNNVKLGLINPWVVLLERYQ